MNDDHFKVQIDENLDGLLEVLGNDLWILICQLQSRRIGVSMSDANSNSKPHLSLCLNIADSLSLAKHNKTISTLKIDCRQHASRSFSVILPLQENGCS
jgi:hypothetical protein